MMDRPLRFCMITTYYPPYNFGGDGIFVHRLSNELARSGHTVDVIHCIDAYHLRTRREPQQLYNDHPNVTVHGLKSPFGLLSPLATQQTGYPLFKSVRIQQILQKGFDVIHYHNISLVGGPKILQYGPGIKLYTMHEYWLVCPTHVLFKYNRSACTQPHCFACSLTYKRPPQWWRHLRLLQTAVKYVDAFIAPSRFCKDMHLRKGLNAPIVHLPYFAPLMEPGSPAPEQLPGHTREKPYFLFVGRLEKLKGLQTLIPLFRHYHKAELLIAGTGSYEGRLKRLAKNSANIRFLGYISNPQLQALYERAVAVVVPSLCFETFSQVIIEAFSQHTPAIVTNLGGMPEMIQESGGGFVYNTDAELLAAMDQLLADPSRRRDMGVRGYEAYQRNWTAKAHLQGYLALIHQVAATRRRSSEPSHVRMGTGSDVVQPS
jgi:glycosyltransferase involved in cell wall biosynthesis